LAEGQRADILLVDEAVPMRPRIVAVIAAGRLLHLTDADRIASRGSRLEAIAAE
jgi:alpha-D-ribose 1-methylphosphonate 5-triphosphate diphosphatase